MTRTDRMTGTIRLSNGTTIAITDELIVNNSVTLREQLVRGNVFQIGTFYTNELDITIFDEDVSRSYANAVITPFYELLLPDGAWEQVKLGKYTVNNSASVRKGEIRRLKAFDDSIRFDVDISGYFAVYPAKNTVAGHIRNICSYVGVALATADLSAFPNSDVETDISKSSAVQTCRDAIEHNSALMGCSARITRDSTLEILQLTAKLSDENEYIFDAVIGGDERRGTEFFDLRALIKYVHTTINGSAVSHTTNFILPEDELGRNAIVTIDTNPLLETLDATDDEKKDIFLNSTISFRNVLRQAEFSFIGNPAIECFDTIAISGGQIDLGRTLAVFPTKSVWKYRSGHSISCASAELTDESTLISEAVMLADETEPVKTPSAVRTKTDKRIDGIHRDKRVDIGIIFSNTAVQEIVHNFTQVGYIKGNSVGYGDVSNKIVVCGYNFLYIPTFYIGTAVDTYYSVMEFPTVRSQSNTVNWSNYKVEARLETVDGKGYKHYQKVVSYIDENGTEQTYYCGSLSTDGFCALVPVWDNISSAVDGLEYGCARVERIYFVAIKDGIVVNSENFPHYDRLYISFSSEAEYNAAVGLTNTPLELTKIQDFQRLVPESQIIVDKELSPDSDNVIANSAVAKALAKKADKADVQSISLAVKEKAESSDLTAHTDDKSNPHKVTKEQIGLSKVENKSSADILSELSIGGTQILRNTQTAVLAEITAPALWSEGAWRKASGTNGVWESIDITDSPEPFIEKGWKIASVGESTSTMQLITITQNNIPLAIGKEYILSCYARGKGTFMISAGGTPTTAQYTAIDHTDWQRYTLPFIAQGSELQSVYFGVRYQGDSVEVCGMKLEIGNRATSWNICPKDIADYEDRIKALEAAILSLGGET